jgi:hypothetical protein
VAERVDPCNALGSVGVSGTYSFYGCSKKATCESYWENNSRSWSMETPIFSLVVVVLNRLKYLVKTTIDIVIL